MIRVIRYEQNDANAIRKSGSWMHATPYYYNLPKEEIAARLRQAIEAGEEGFTVADLGALDAGQLSVGRLGGDDVSHRASPAGTGGETCVRGDDPRLQARRAVVRAGPLAADRSGNATESRRDVRRGRE